jgi:hypothetical protein
VAGERLPAVVGRVRALPDVVALAVGRAGPRPVGAEAAEVAVALRVRSGEPVVRLAAAASPRSSVVKSSTK